MFSRLCLAVGIGLIVLGAVGFITGACSAWTSGACFVVAIVWDRVNRGGDEGEAK